MIYRATLEMVNKSLLMNQTPSFLHTLEFVTVCVCVSCTHGFGVDRVHCEEERRDESQAWVLEHAALARVHEQAGYGAVQTHVDDVEIQRRHATQQDVQPDR